MKTYNIVCRDTHGTIQTFSNVGHTKREAQAMVNRLSEDREHRYEPFSFAIFECDPDDKEFENKKIMALG